MFKTVLLATGCTDQSTDLAADDEPALGTTPEQIKTPRVRALPPPFDQCCYPIGEPRTALGSATAPRRLHSRVRCTAWSISALCMRAGTWRHERDVIAACRAKTEWSWQLRRSPDRHAEVCRRIVRRRYLDGTPAEPCCAQLISVIAIAPGLAPITIRVTGECVTTGKRRTTDFFLVNRVEVREEPTQPD